MLYFFIFSLFFGPPSLSSLLSLPSPAVGFFERTRENNKRKRSSYFFCVPLSGVVASAAWTLELKPFAFRVCLLDICGAIKFHLKVDQTQSLIFISSINLAC